jgi:drug/metabolite transporter (DMT)-like permease
VFSPSPAPDPRGLAQVAVAAAAWGTWSLFLRPYPVPTDVASVIVFAVMGLAGLALVRLDPKPRWDRTAWLLLAGHGLVDAVNVLCFFGAIRRTTVAIAVLTHYLAPILVALLAPVIDRTRTPYARVAAVAATIGLTLVLAPWRPENRGGDALAGALLGAASAVCYATNVFLVRRLSARIGAGRTVAYHSLISAALLAPLALRWPLPAAGALALVAAGGILAGTGAGFLFAAGLPRIGAARTAVLTFLEPIVAVGLGWLVWHEQLGLQALAGGAMILGAGILVARGGAAGVTSPG